MPYACRQHLGDDAGAGAALWNRVFAPVPTFVPVDAGFRFLSGGDDGLPESLAALGVADPGRRTSAAGPAEAGPAARLTR
jgi:hypothetical protein